MKKIREPAVAGQFYPADKTELQNMVQNFIDNAKVNIDGKIYGIIVPHAGFVYSGQTAAYAYKAIQNKENVSVIILGPYHGPKKYTTPMVRERCVSVYKEGEFKTPLGNVEIDTTITNKLIESSERIKFIPEAHIDEHSVEIQIPFLQTVLKNFKIVPIVMIDQSFDICNELSNAIVNAIENKDVLIVASSDFYHGENYEECKKSVDESCNFISNYAIKDFYNAFVNKNAACGGGCITVAMLVCKKLGANKIIPLWRTNSNDVIGQKGGYVVGYASFVITEEDDINFTPLNEESQKELLQLARKAIEVYLKEKKILEYKPKSKQLLEKRGVFVTLRTKDGELRGCIGHHEADTPLYKLVPQMALASAFQDYRFPPLTLKELKDIKIKISVYLCKVHPIKDISEYELGVHGIIMEKDGRSATFLPEVPKEENWTKEQTLNYLSMKAGLPKDAWKSGAKFFVYKTQVFGE